MTNTGKIMEKFLSNSEINKMFFMVIGEGSKLDPRFVIDEDSPEDIMDVFGDLTDGDADVFED